jgi:protein SCO1
VKRRAVVLLAATAGAVYALRPGAVDRAGVADTSSLPVFESSDLTPQWRSAAELAQRPGRFVPFALQDQSGRLLTEADLRGKVVVANFFFTHCGSLCPKLTTAMAQVRDAHRRESRLLLLSHSVTPEVDTPAMLQAYAQSNQIDGRQWRLLTGAPEQISRVAHEGYLVPRTAVGAEGVIHTELFVLLDAQQRVRGVYNGTLRMDVQQLIGDVKTLLG